MDVPALERCVGDVDRFFERHWDRAPLLTGNGARSAGFDDLASLDDLDHMVASMGLHASSFRMVRDGKTLPPSVYTTTSTKRSSGDAFVSGALVYERFSEGATIVLESLHRYWKPLSDFCRDLELSLGHRLQVNAYITPPGSQGFDVHRDTHDVFVLQVSGTKHWIVYDREDPTRVLIDRDIERGMSLYIPTGFPHAASTGRGSSAHLTVGILTHESMDVVRELMKLAEEEGVFSDRLPAHTAGDTRRLKETVARSVELMKTWLDKVDLDELSERVARRIFSTAQPIVRGQLRQFERLESTDGEALLRRRRGAICVLFRKGNALRVLLADRELEMPLSVEPAMAEVSRRDTFRVRDLHSSLDRASASTLVKRLVREGLLEVVIDE